MSCKYCDKAADYAVHHGMKEKPIMTCKKHIQKGMDEVQKNQNCFQVAVQDMEKYKLWKLATFTQHYGQPPKGNDYHINLVDSWISGFKSILDAKPIKVVFRYARREAMTMVIPAKNWNDLKLAFLERPQIFAIDKVTMVGGAKLTHYVNRHRAWYLDIWEIDRKLKFVFGPLHLDVYQNNCRIEPAPLGFMSEVPGRFNPQLQSEKPLNQGDLCFNCGERVGTTGSSYNRRVVCLECYQKLSKVNLVEVAEKIMSIPAKCVECGEGTIDRINKVMSGLNVCKVCFDRFYNTEINYRCRGCGAIIPDKGKICAKCGPECSKCKTHKGPFKQVDGKLYCSLCLDPKVEQNIPFKIMCEGCGTPKFTHALGNKAYCDKCWKELKCCHCNNVAGEDSVIFKGNMFCKECFDKLNANCEED